ncbi:MAG: ATP-binding protein [Ramlibacter sp.]
MLETTLDAHGFGTEMASLVSPARPIQSIEFLRGRAKELSRIDRALFAPGRHIFVYGDRGIGKSSLAAAAAAQAQSADSSYIDVACSTDSTFRSVIANIGSQAIRLSRIYRSKKTLTAGLELRFLRATASEEITVNDLHDVIRTVGDAVEVLREVATVHSDRPVVVVDEFDRMTDERERALFSDLVKQLGDKKINVIFFFTGVAPTLDQLLGAHPSAIRQFETIELQKLNWTARWDIAVNALAKFGVEIEDNIRVRIAAVSDGYPAYVHLITEKLLWRLWDAPKVITNVDWEHYNGAIQDAILSVNAELKRPYEQAVNQRTEDFEEVLWAAADSEYLDRDLRQLYSSYGYVMRQRPGRVAMDYKQFTATLNKLKTKSCGEIIVASRFDRRGWVAYRESMLRGYARMRAEARNIKLVGEQEAPRQVMHAPGASGRSFGPSIPKGVHTGRIRMPEEGPADE